LLALPGGGARQAFRNIDISSSTRAGIRLKDSIESGRNPDFEARRELTGPSSWLSTSWWEQSKRLNVWFLVETEMPLRAKLARNARCFGRAYGFKHFILEKRNVTV
jgi:hypothetical protein